MCLEQKNVSTNSLKSGWVSQAQLLLFRFYAWHWGHVRSIVSVAMKVGLLSAIESAHVSPGGAYSCTFYTLVSFALYVVALWCSH